QRVGQFVDVQHRAPLQLGHFIEVEIVSDDLAFVHLGQFDQFQVHFTHGGEVVFHNLNLQGRDLLDALQDVKAAAAAVALHGVSRVGDQLKFSQYELGNHDHTVQEAGLGDVGDATVDDHARVEDLVALPGLLLATENAAQCRQIEQVALASAHHQTYIGHDQHHEKL